MEVGLPELDLLYFIFLSQSTMANRTVPVVLLYVYTKMLMHMQNG